MTGGLRVLVLANARYPIREPFVGGLESWTWWLVHGLRRRGASVTVFAGAGTDPALRANELSAAPLELSAAARADVSMPPVAWMHEHHAYLQAMLYAIRADGAFDVVHNASLHYLPVAFSEALPCPMITTLHTPPTPWLESAVAVCRDRVRLVAVSDHTAAAWRHVGRVRVIRNGIDLDAWRPGRGGTPIVWSGRIVPEKAPHHAAMIARAAGIPLRIAGPIVDAEYFAARVAPLLGWDVQYVGHLAQPALSQLIGSSAATLVTPVWDEPYGLVVAESLACGTPVCAYGRGGVAELLNDTCSRLVAPGDIAGAARALWEVIYLSRAAARRQAEDHCSIAQMLDGYCELYRNASASGVGGP